MVENLNLFKTLSEDGNETSFLFAYPINRSLPQNVINCKSGPDDDELGFFGSSCSFLNPSIDNSTGWELNTNSPELTIPPAYKTLRSAVTCLVIPIICMFGLVGNMYNCYIFYCKWLRKFMDRLERCTTVGLIYLAVSDALFCFFCIAKIFELSSLASNSTIYFYYVLYKKVILNVFLWNSAWLIAVVSMQRLAYVSGHWHDKLNAQPRNVIIICTLTFLFSIISCLPILISTIFSITCSPDGICYQTGLVNHPLSNSYFETFYRSFIIIVGFLTPMGLLIYSNIHLIIVLHRTKPMTDRTRCCRFQVTFVIWIIVVSFLILVSPSMIVECLLATRVISSAPQRGIAILLTNLFQVIKFSSNFMFYTIFNRQFRKEAFICFHLK